MFKRGASHCISEGTLSLENVRCNFHFILHVIPDKAAFVSSALLCVQRYRGIRYFSHFKAPPADGEFLINPSNLRSKHI